MQALRRSLPTKYVRLHAEAAGASPEARLDGGPEGGRASVPSHILPPRRRAR